MMGISMKWHGLYMGFSAFLVILGLLLVGIVVVRAGRRELGSRRFRHESAMQILRERYVRGEIDEETFRRMKNELNK